MAKFSKKTTEKIVELVKSDTYTIAEMCRQVGISQRTYHLWIEEHPDFAEAIEQAKDERMQFFVIEAKKSLLKKIKGYDVVETHVTTVPDKNGNPVIKEQKNVKKHIQPDTAAVISAMARQSHTLAQTSFLIAARRELLYSSLIVEGMYPQ